VSLVDEKERPAMANEKEIHDALTAMEHRNQERHEAQMAILQGRHDDNGQWHPGIAPRLVELEKWKLLKEQQDLEHAKHQLTWKHGAAITFLSVGLSKLIDFISTHMK
jgi:hypothetical protein